MIEIYLIITSVLFCIASGSTLWALWLHKSLKDIKRHLKDNPDFQTQLVLSDMMQAGSLVRIERIPPENVYLRRN